MAMAPYSPLPLLSFPASSSLSPSPSSLYILLRRPNQRVSSSRQTLPADTGDPPIGSLRKKRKPKPSFLRQVQDKWSLKHESKRDKFPWQVQDEEEDEGLEGMEPPQQRQEPQPPKSVHEGSREMIFDSQVGYISAPWVVGYAHRKSPFGSVHDDSPRNSAENGVEEANGFLETSKDEARFSVKLTGSDDNYDGVNGDDKGLLKSTERKSFYLGRASDVSFDANAEEKGNNFGGLRDDLGRDSDNLPWQEEEDGRQKKRSNTELAESMIPEHELKRLRNVALRMLERIKVGDAGITEALVESIHKKWEMYEVVKLKFEGPQSKNMKRTHEMLESRTGGLVIWRSGSSIVLYRGISYQLPCVQLLKEKTQASSAVETGTLEVKDPNMPGSTEHPQHLSDQELIDIDNLLDELGPRFKDWSGREPLPVDADLLPSVIPDFKSPFRLLPHGVRPCLRNKAMTNFRRLARMIPPHFALGRSRKLQGLAQAMVKLWERSAIAKIAIKRGVANTCNDRMAEELKHLTGGILLSRNKEFIVFYRGNDFLPPTVKEALQERQKLANDQQNKEEQMRLMASSSISSSSNQSNCSLVAGTLAETLAATSRWGCDPSSEDVEQMLQDSSLDRHESLVRLLKKKLALAKRKVRKAEYSLAKLQENLDPSDLPSDLETMTDEERFLFRKMGLSMKPYLLIGRREVFDGTVENMHLHWKHRELVKLIVRGKSLPQVKHLAISLEAESGGLLVSVDKTPKGYAIIVYRGKNYQRPSRMRPQNLLTRRQALARSIELQRREALKHHILDLEEKIDLLKSEIEEKKSGKKTDDRNVSSGFDAFAESDFEETDEDGEGYSSLEDYDSENENLDDKNEESDLNGLARRG